LLRQQDTPAVHPYNSAVQTCNHADLGYLSGNGTDDGIKVIHQHVRRVTDPSTQNEELQMNAGKILIGLALIAISFALMVNPSVADGGTLPAAAGGDYPAGEPAGIIQQLAGPLPPMDHDMARTGPSAGSWTDPSMRTEPVSPAGSQNATYPYERRMPDAHPLFPDPFGETATIQQSKPCTTIREPPALTPETGSLLRFSGSYNKPYTTYFSKGFFRI
jgi:hypothetical protein